MRKKQIAFTINNLEQAEGIITEAKIYKIIPILHFKNYILAGFGSDFIITFKNILISKFGKSSFKLFVDCGFNYGLSIDMIAFKIGPLEVRWYGLAYLAGILLGLQYAKWIIRNYKEKNKISVSINNIDEIFIWVVIGIIFGAKIGYLVFYNPSSLLQNPLNIFAIWQGGMSFHGGATGVILAIIIYSLAKKISLFELGDIICSVVPIGLFFGRVANYINSELWGKVTEVSWGVVFPNAGNLPRHPSQLYEAFLEGLVIFLILFIMIKKNLLNYSGFISGSFLFLYGLFRIFVENFREPDLHIGYIYNFVTMGMILSFPFMIAGMCIMFYAIKTNGKN